MLKRVIIYLDVKSLHKKITFIAIVKISHLYKMPVGLVNISYKVSVVLFIKLILNYETGVISHKH